MSQVLVETKAGLKGIAQAIKDRLGRLRQLSKQRPAPHSSGRCGMRHCENNMANL